MPLKPTTEQDLETAAKYTAHLKRILSSDTAPNTAYAYYSKFTFFSEKKTLPVIVFGAAKSDVVEKVAASAKKNSSLIKKGKVQSVEEGGKVKLKFDKGGSIYRAVIENTFRVPDSVVVAKDDEEENVTELPGGQAYAEKKLPIEKVDLTKAKKGALLGSGNFGEVYRLKGSDDKPLVMKTAKNPEGLAEMNHEAEMYEKVGANPNIARCYGIQKVDGQDGLVMEEVKGGKVEDVFKKLGSLQDAEKNGISKAEYWAAMQHIMKGTLNGLAALEKVGVGHNDIKDDNIMFDPETFEPKIIDFGLSKEHGQEQPMRAVKFQAPEAVVHNAKVESSQDAFSSGQMLYEQTQGGLFAKGFKVVGKGITMKQAKEAQNNFVDTNTKVLTPNKPGALPPEKQQGPGKYASGKYSEDFESQFVQFMNAIMDPDPTKRMKPSEALNHPFLKDNLMEGGTIDKAALFKKIMAADEPPFAPNSPAQEYPAPQQPNQNDNNDQSQDEDPKYNTDPLLRRGTTVSNNSGPAQSTPNIYAKAPSSLPDQARGSTPPNNPPPRQPNGPVYNEYVQRDPNRVPANSGPTQANEPVYDKSPGSTPVPPQSNSGVQNRPTPPANNSNAPRTNVTTNAPVATGSLFGRSAKPAPSLADRVKDIDAAIATLKNASSKPNSVNEIVAAIERMRQTLDAAMSSNLRAPEVEPQIVAIKKKLDEAHNALHVSRLSEAAVETAALAFPNGGAATLKKNFPKAPPMFAALITALEQTEAVRQIERAAQVQNLAGAANAYLQFWNNLGDRDKRDEKNTAMKTEATRLLGAANQVIAANRALGV